MIRELEAETLKVSELSLSRYQSLLTPCTYKSLSESFLRFWQVVSHKKIFSIFHLGFRGRVISDVTVKNADDDLFSKSAV